MDILKYFKLLLAAILSILIILIIFKLLYYIAFLLYTNPFSRYEAVNIKNMLGDILLVLVLIELLRTVLIYIKNQDLYLDALVEAAFIAVLRKIILIEVENPNPWYIFAITALFVSSAIIYRHWFYKVYSIDSGNKE